MADAFTAAKGVFSITMLLLSIAFVNGLIFTRQTPFADDYHPAVAFLSLWIFLIWLSMVEGGQASLVGLAPVQRDLYKESHPITYAATTIGHKGDNLDRYLLGRQFMVIFIVFIINKSGTPLVDAEIWGLPSWAMEVLVTSGIALILLTCMVGQLHSQVTASHCMLDYINDAINFLTMRVAMMIEASGIVHASYLIQMLVAKLSDRPIESQEEPRTGLRLVTFWARCLMSLAILIFSFVITIVALFEGKTTMWKGLPNPVSVLIFLFLMCVVGMLEGMQIAFFAVAKLKEDERGDSMLAKKTCQLLFAGKGHNLPGFMIGRQLMVVSCFFFIARVTTMKIEEGKENVLGVNDTIQSFFNLGFLGALITTIVASISWQLVAAAFPSAFLDSSITYLLLCAGLGLERTGVCQGAWVLSSIHRQFRGFKHDEEYIGTAEERAARHMGDRQSSAVTGYMAALPGFAHNNSSTLRDLMKNDPTLKQFNERSAGRMEEARK